MKLKFTIKRIVTTADTAFKQWLVMFKYLIDFPAENFYFNRQFTKRRKVMGQRR